jgi:hypothetical protein
MVTNYSYENSILCESDNLKMTTTRTRIATNLVLVEQWKTFEKKLFEATMLSLCRNIQHILHLKYSTSSPQK